MAKEQSKNPEKEINENQDMAPDMGDNPPLDAYQDDLGRLDEEQESDFDPVAEGEQGQSEEAPPAPEQGTDIDDDPMLEKELNSEGQDMTGEQGGDFPDEPEMGEVEESISDNDSPQQGSAEKDSVEQESPEQESPEQESPEQESPESETNDTVEEQDVEEEAPEQEKSNALLNPTETYLLREELKGFDEQFIRAQALDTILTRHLDVDKVEAFMGPLDEKTVSAGGREDRYSMRHVINRLAEVAHPDYASAAKVEDPDQDSNLRPDQDADVSVKDKEEARKEAQDKDNAREMGRKGNAAQAPGNSNQAPQLKIPLPFTGGKKDAVGDTSVKTTDKPNKNYSEKQRQKMTEEAEKKIKDLHDFSKEVEKNNTPKNRRLFNRHMRSLKDDLDIIENFLEDEHSFKKGRKGMNDFKGTINNMNNRLNDMKDKRIIEDSNAVNKIHEMLQSFSETLKRAIKKIGRAMGVGRNDPSI